ALAAASAYAFDTNAPTGTALSSLHARPEADNCASALWLFSSAKASLLFRSARYYFAYHARSIRLASCPKCSVNSPIQQRSGRTLQRKILTNLRRPPHQPNFLRTKLASQRRSHG